MVIQKTIFLFSQSQIILGERFFGSRIRCFRSCRGSVELPPNSISDNNSSLFLDPLLIYWTPTAGSGDSAVNQMDEVPDLV